MNIFAGMLLFRKNLLLLTFLAPLFLFAQEEKVYPSQVTYRMGYGFITNHSPSMLYFTGQHLSHHEITFEKSNLLDSEWGKEFPHSNYGIGLSYFDLNTPVLGDGISVYPYLNFSLWRATKITFNIRTAIGVGTITKPFDESDNYKNSAIGTHVNLFFSFLGELKWRIHDQYSLNLAADFSHFSNTSFQKPNLGINIPSINAGLSYHFGQKLEKAKASEKQPFERKNSFTEVSAGLGLNEIYPAGGDKYVTKYFSAYQVKRMNGKSSLSIGLDYFHNPAISELLKRDSVQLDGNESHQFGIGIGHYLHLGKFALGNTMGYYLKNENPEYPSIYLGVSGNYQVSNKLTAFILLKTHRAEAEYLISGLRYQFHE